MLILLVECGAGRHIDGGRLVVVVSSCSAMVMASRASDVALSLARSVLLKWIYLAGLWLEVEHFRSQEAAMCRCTSATYILLNTCYLSVVTTSTVLFTSCTAMVWLRICIVVRGAILGKHWWSPDTRCSLRLLTYHRHAHRLLLGCRRLMRRLLLHLSNLKGMGEEGKYNGWGLLTRPALLFSWLGVTSLYWVNA